MLFVNDSVGVHGKHKVLVCVESVSARKWTILFDERPMSTAESRPSMLTHTAVESDTDWTTACGSVERDAMEDFPANAQIDLRNKQAYCYVLAMAPYKGRLTEHVDGALWTVRILWSEIKSIK